MLRVTYSVLATLITALILTAASRRVIIQGVYDRSIHNGLGCPIAPIVNRHTLKVANKTIGKQAVHVAIMLDRALADYCSHVYRHFLVQVVTLNDINATHIVDKASWLRLRRFDLGNERFHRGDKLLFLDLDAYVTGMDVDAMFEAISDTDGNRFLMATDFLGHFAADTSVMLLSYRPTDFQALMQTYQRLAAMDVAMRTDRELFAWHARDQGEKYMLPGSMTVLAHEMYRNFVGRSRLLVHPNNSQIPLVRIIRFGDPDLRFYCQGVERNDRIKVGVHVEAMSCVLAWVCCSSKMVVQAIVEHGGRAPLLQTIPVGASPAFVCDNYLHQRSLAHQEIIKANSGRSGRTGYNPLGPQLPIFHKTNPAGPAALTGLTVREMQQKLFGYPNVNVSAMTPDEKMQYWEMEFTYRVQVHEASVRQKLVELALGLPANSVVVDSGAHVGDTGISLAQRLHEAGRTDVHVLMVEPDASKVAWITKKLGQLGNVKASVINSGLFSTTTRANVLRSAAHPGGWKIIPHVADGEVQLRSISDILALERPRDFFGLWHLDVEGTELHALKGLGVHRPRHILMEVVHDGSKEKHPAQEYLNTLGYKLLQRLAENDGLFELSKPGSM